MSESPLAGWFWPSEFDFASAPLNKWYYSATTSVLYLGLIFFLDARHRAKSDEEKKKRPLSTLLAYHNLSLSIMSLIMFGGMILAVFMRLFREQSPYFLACEDESTTSTGPMFAWAYWYHLSKYYELLDTILGYLNNAPPKSFRLHVFHHALVLSMSFWWLELTISLQQLAVIYNTGVHILMYYYYYLQSDPNCGYIWWKNYVTYTQVFQFVSSVLVWCYTMYMVHIVGVHCAGMSMVYFQMIFNVWMLAEFINVLRINNSRRRAKKAAAKGDAGKISDKPKHE